MLKIAMIGAGSVGFTRKLVMDILAVEELRDTEFRFMDISEDNLRMATGLCRKLIADNGLGATIAPTTDQREAIRGADYVVSTVRVGGLEAFGHDSRSRSSMAWTNAWATPWVRGASFTGCAPSPCCWASPRTCARWRLTLC